MEHGHLVAGVGFPIAIPGVYDYTVPDTLQSSVAPGTAVLVEVRSRKLWGVVVRIAAQSPCKSLKPILEVKPGHWTDANSSLIELYRWIAQYYQCDLGRVFKPFVRKGLLNGTAKETTVFVPQPRPARPLTAKQESALGRIVAANLHPPTAANLRDQLGVSRAVLTTLCKAGALRRENVQICRDLPVARLGGTAEVILTNEQQHAVEGIAADLDAPRKPFLLHGITGSGKTHVYIELVRRVLAKGKGAIILVPEISLTPQTISRFSRAVNAEIAVIHSRMSEGERRDSLEQLVTGRRRLVIGARSAVLAPLDGLGLLIVDEEHDGSYKQTDTEPRYHARDVAIIRGRIQKATVVLGSATPALESYNNALVGKYNLVKINQRFGSACLPKVHIVDMNAEHRDNNWTFLSRFLEQLLHSTLDNGRQAILLLNRRGYSSFLICKDCGHTYTCPNCSVKLVYHRTDLVLRCHQCAHAVQAPQICPVCKGEHLHYRGTAIQKAEEVLRERFPAARVLRMDQDTTRRKGSHESLLEQFAGREANILLGTQMVAKGLDFPGVSLVGVLNADIGLHVPDFRASERTFQLLAQVAGRAGRNDSLGEVVFQTYLPHDPAVLCAQRHDYEAFYQSEFENRQLLGYPPVGRLVRLVAQGAEEDRVRILAEATAARLTKLLPRDAVLLGPSPALLAKVKNVFRYTILIKTGNYRGIQSVLASLREERTGRGSDTRLLVDVDPLHML